MLVNHCCNDKKLFETFVIGLEIVGPGFGLLMKRLFSCGRVVRTDVQKTSIPIGRQVGKRAKVGRRLYGYGMAIAMATRACCFSVPSFSVSFHQLGLAHSGGSVHLVWLLAIKRLAAMEPSVQHSPSERNNGTLGIFPLTRDSLVTDLRKYVAWVLTAFT